MRKALDDVDFAGLAEFRHQIRLFLHFSGQAARAAGLKPQQHQLMLALRGMSGAQGVPIHQLAEKLILRHHSAVGLVDRLAKRGFVARKRDADDLRCVSVRLTRRGEQVLARLSRHHLAELRTAGPRLVRALLAVMRAETTRRGRRR